jgi:putative flippase GtrA
MPGIKERIQGLFKNKKVRFLFVGALNTVFGYAVYSMFIFFGLHYLAAQFFGSILAITHSYLWNKHFTFKSKEKSAGEVLRFISVYAVSYVLNMILLYVLIDRLKINQYLAGAAGIFITTIISYVGHKKVSFRQNNI